MIIAVAVVWLPAETVCGLLEKRSVHSEVAQRRSRGVSSKLVVAQQYANTEVR